MTSKKDLTIHLRSNELSCPTDSEDIIVTSKLSSTTIPESFIPVSTITVNIDSIELYDPLSLASLVTSLCKDGSGQVILTIPSSAKSNLSPVHTSIALAGLIPQSEKTENSKRCITSIYKPKSKTSSSAAIRINSNIKKIQPVKINLGVLSGEEDLIDEEDLLSSTPIGINAPAEIDVAERQKQLDDCGGRKACDNCTCGRKEMEESEQSGNQNETPEISKSACGNCAKGDAFRCAGCPFLGKPAFKEGGEHLVLDLTDDL